VHAEQNKISLEQGGEGRLISKNSAYSSGSNSNSNGIVGGSSMLLFQESKNKP